MFDTLNNRNFLITGGSGGIGQAIAKEAKKNGARIALWGHHKIENVDMYADIYQIVELTDILQIQQAFGKVEKYLGTIDVLINCAGFTNGESSENYSLEMWNKTLAINLTAPFVLCQLAAKSMIKKQSGSIINITSIGAELGFPNNPAYGASKGGLKQLSKALACDWGKYGIRVNNVAPGYTRTKMTLGSWEDKEMREHMTKRTMLGRWAETSDIADTVLFLASDRAKYITGQDIYVDGGWCAQGL